MTIVKQVNGGAKSTVSVSDKKKSSNQSRLCLFLSFVFISYHQKKNKKNNSFTSDIHNLCKGIDFEGVIL